MRVLANFVNADSELESKELEESKKEEGHP
jgi:hypothetical protein